MADVQVPLLSVNGKDTQHVRSRRWLKLGTAILSASASCLVLLFSTGSAAGSSEVASFLTQTKPASFLGPIDPAMFLAVKRQSAESSQDGKKKVKKEVPVVAVDPIQQKIDVVCGALRSDEYDVGCRDMLLATAPLALADAKDKRHSYYEKVVNMMSEVFAQQENRLKERLAEKQAVIDGADARHITLEAQKQNMTTRLLANQVDLDAKRATQETHKALLEESEGKLQQAMEDITGLKAAFKNLVTGKERKENVWSNRNQNAYQVKELLNEISTSKSLLTALPFALYQKPAARDAFDNITMSEMTKTFTNHLSNLKVQIQDTQKDVAEKEGKMLTVERAVEFAKEQLRVSSEMVERGENVRKNLESELEQAQNALMQHEPAVKSASDDVMRYDNDLKAFHNILGQFSELRDRVEARAVLEANTTKAADMEVPLQAIEPMIEEAGTKAALDNATTATMASLDATRPAMEAKLNHLNFKADPAVNEAGPAVKEAAEPAGKEATETVMSVEAKVPAVKEALGPTSPDIHSVLAAQSPCVPCESQSSGQLPAMGFSVPLYQEQRVPVMGLSSPIFQGQRAPCCL